MKLTKTELVARRFGPSFDRECKRAYIVECATWECQVANCCRFDDHWSESFKAGRAALKEMGE